MTATLNRAFLYLLHRGFSTRIVWNSSSKFKIILSSFLWDFLAFSYDTQKQKELQQFLWLKIDKYSDAQN